MAARSPSKSPGSRKFKICRRPDIEALTEVQLCLHLLIARMSITVAISLMASAIVRD